MSRLTGHEVEIVFRIPGRWESRDEFIAALPEGCTLGERDGVHGLLTHDGDCVEAHIRPHDDDFLEVFAGACRHAPSERDREIVENWLVQVCLSGPGGSFESAHRLMRAGCAVIKAGGGGVFIDNSGNAHGSDDFFDLTDDPDNTAEGGDRGGIYWAFAATVGGKKEVWTMGMNALGLKDAIMPRGFGGAGAEDIHATKADYNMIHNFLAYSYRSGVELHDGDLIGNECFPRPVRITHEPCPEEFTAGSPLHNPWGRWRLTPMNEG
jgi:hypothetical protein